MENQSPRRFAPEPRHGQRVGHDVRRHAQTPVGFFESGMDSPVFSISHSTSNPERVFPANYYGKYVKVRSPTVPVRAFPATSVIPTSSITVFVFTQVIGAEKSSTTVVGEVSLAALILVPI